MSMFSFLPGIFLLAINYTSPAQVALNVPVGPQIIIQSGDTVSVNSSFTADNGNAITVDNF